MKEFTVKIDDEAIEFFMTRYIDTDLDHRREQFIAWYQDDILNHVYGYIKYELLPTLISDFM